MKRRWGSGNGEGGRMEGKEEMAYQLSRLDTAWCCAEAWRGGVRDAGCHFRFLLLNLWWCECNAFETWGFRNAADAGLQL